MVDIVNCSKCKNNSILFIATSGTNLCKSHFFEKFEKTARQTIREFGLLEKTKRLGVALSGGKDSTATLYMLHPLAQEMSIELIAITVDEGIAGYRDKSIEVASKICKDLGVEHVVKSYKDEIGFKIDDIVKIDERDPACSYCGVFRRWVLNKAAKELSLDKLALGHNLDDTSQTILMNILRNEPFRLARFGATSGIVDDESFVPRIKPLMRIPEKWVAVWALLNDLPIH
ncbi:tRNA 2-thiocytidine biosynthesis protein TtcA, partial [Candidatus Micrarchaeota archaeon]|nr:tRNA 2-thiocytidine biosynthesis protein TtcA [Candidatus Micrarchaeota archaeon]